MTISKLFIGSTDVRYSVKQCGKIPVSSIFSRDSNKLAFSGFAATFTGMMSADVCFRFAAATHLLISSM